MKTAIIMITMMMLAIPAAMASTKTFKVTEDPAFKLKMITSPAKIASKTGYIPAFQDKERNVIPRRYLSAEQALPTASTTKFSGKESYILGPRVNVASVSKLTPVKPKYELKPELPTESGVRTIGTFGAKLSTTTAFPKSAFSSRQY